MKIRKAMKLACNGNKVRRQKWVAGFYVKVAGVETIHIWCDDEIMDGEILSASDILAEDWQVV